MDRVRLDLRARTVVGKIHGAGDQTGMKRERCVEDWLDFVVDTLKQLDESVQGAFLKVFLMRLVSLEVSEKESIGHWEEVLARQSELTEKLGRPVTLRTAAVDYFEEQRILHSPILMEYGELRKLRYNAGTDSLTGLNNRRIFEEQLNREINRGSRHGSVFSLLSLDLRKFKSVNDTYGHATGDEILRSVARSCAEVLRASDTTSRTGGDEFAILLPEAERPSAQVLAERIAKKFREHAKVIAPDTAVAMDYGIAIFPEDGHDAATLFASADKDLYKNKHMAHRRAAAELPATVETTADPRDAAPQATASVETQVQPPAPAPAAAPLEMPAPPPPATGVLYARKDERVSLEGTPALGVVRVGGKSTTVRVMNISNGGVCLMVDQLELPDVFSARLQVPMAPRGDLTLHRVYSLPISEGKRRVGCSFGPLSDPLLV